MLDPGTTLGSAAMRRQPPDRSSIARSAGLALLAACALAWAVPGGAQSAAPGAAADAPDDLAGRSRAMERARQAVVGVQAVAVDDARSIRTLGRNRGGSGVVISDDGLVLTIGYLVLEAEQVELVLDGERSVPARVVGYDMATGFGLLQALAPLRIAPAPLAPSRALTPDEPLMIASGGEDGAVSVAGLVAQRPFSGYWEYHLDKALVTAPARRDHSGAGLFNGRGELVGIGSLFLADARSGTTSAAADANRQPGNLFVPSELLPPILAELTSQGMSRASRRAWIGLNCAEVDGQVRVLRVSDDSPADVAGLQAGDQILRIDGTEVNALATLWKALWAGGPAERALTLDIRRDGQAQSLTVNSVDRSKTLRRAQGI